MTHRSVVLAYHALGDVDPADDVHNLFTATRRFERQMRWLARYRRVVPLDLIVEGRHRSGDIAVTFDDAYCSVAEIGLPLLRRLGLPATIFVPTAYLGDRNRWNARSRLDLSIMSEEDLCRADRLGFSLQSHGHAHIDMRVAEPEQVRSDLAASQQILTEVVGTPPRTIAWPFRTGSLRAQTIAKSLGFVAAFSIDLPGQGRFAWPRPQVVPADGRLLFGVKASGAYLPLRFQPLVDSAYQRLVVSRRVLSNGTGTPSDQP